MNDTEFVVQTFYRFEKLLKQIGANGKGFGEYVKNIEHRLPKSLTRNLMSINRVRVGCIHHLKPIHNREQFETRCIEAEEDLQFIASLLAAQSPPLYFYLINKMSGKALDAPSAEQVHQWGFHRGDNQAWSIHRIDNDFFSIISKLNNKCLEVAESSYDAGKIVQQNQYNNLANQQWKFIEQEDGSYQIIARHSEKCLDAHYPKIYEDGAVIVQWDWCNGENQKWWIKPAL